MTFVGNFLRTFFANIFHIIYSLILGTSSIFCGQLGLRDTLFLYFKVALKMSPVISVSVIIFVVLIPGKCTENIFKILLNEDEKNPKIMIYRQW